jgi:hypothetical protein
MRFGRGWKWLWFVSDAVIGPSTAAQISYIKRGNQLQKCCGMFLLDFWLFFLSTLSSIFCNV